MTTYNAMKERAEAAEARVRELEIVRDALIRSEEAAQQLEELVSNQAQEYIERAEAAEQRAEESERAFGLLEEAHKSTTEKFASMMARVAELEAQNARLRGALVDCHAYLMRRITLLTLNESASDTTQSLAREVSVALDALADGKATL